LAQSFPDFVATQNVCVDEEVTYSGYGLDGSELFFDIYLSDEITPVSIGNVLTLVDLPVTVLTGAGLYYKYEYKNYTWSTPGTFIVKIREKTPPGCEGGNTTHLTVIVSPLPNISSLSFNVTTPVCKNTSPVFTVSGLDVSTAYSIGYDDNGSSKVVNVTTDGVGSCTLPVDAIVATATYNIESVAFNDGNTNCAASPAPSLTAEASFIETTVPTAVCQPVTIQLDGTGNASIVAADIDNGSSDNCGTVSLSASKTTFDCSNVGANSVTLTVTDSNGNSDSCVAIVTVLDAENPTIATLADIDVDADAGVCTYASSQLTAPTANDNCSVASVVATPASLVSGPNTVTWTVTDGAGNTKTSTQTVTVLDAENPTIVCPADVTVNIGGGLCTATGIDLGTVPTGSDNCSVVSVTNDAPAVFPIGNTTVTWTVTDGFGNEGTCAQIVAVTKDNNIAVVDVTGTSDPETDGGIVNGTHCPNLNGIQAVVAPSGNTYSAGKSQVQFRVDRLCDTGAWSFTYSIEGVGVNVDKVLISDIGTSTNSLGVVNVPAGTNYVLFTIDVDNVVNTVLPIDFKISDGGTESAIKDDITIQHNLKIIPLIGGFE